MNDLEEIHIVSKYDYELSKNEIKKIFLIYNECFFDFKCTGTKNITQAYQLIGNSHTWRWYLAYLGSDLIGIASYVYDTSHVKSLGMQVNVDVGENICNVGVKSKFRRRGVAKCLMEEIIDDYSLDMKTNLIVEVVLGARSNPTSLGTPHYLKVMGLYLGLGFKELDSGKNDTEQVRYLIYSPS